MKIHIGSDHAGFELKEKLVNFLRGLGHEIVDHGAFAFDEKDDYPDFVIPTAEAVAKDPESKGIIIGGSGEGRRWRQTEFRRPRAVIYRYDEK